MIQSKQLVLLRKQLVLLRGTRYCRVIGIVVLLRGTRYCQDTSCCIWLQVNNSAYCVDSAYCVSSYCVSSYCVVFGLVKTRRVRYYQGSTTSCMYLQVSAGVGHVALDCMCEWKHSRDVALDCMWMECIAHMCHWTHVALHCMCECRHSTHVGIRHVCACDTCCIPNLLHLTQGCIACCILHKLALHARTQSIFVPFHTCSQSIHVAFNRYMLHSIDTCCIQLIHVAFNRYMLHSIDTYCIPSLHYTSFQYKPTPQRPNNKRTYIHRRSRSIIPERGDDPRAWGSWRQRPGR